MKIALFGATGKTGIEVINQSLIKGHMVNAFVRDESKLQLINQKLTIFPGDATKPETFGGLLNGVDAVAVTLGGIMADAIKNIISEMKSKKINKLVLMSSYPMSGSPEGISYLKSAGMDQTKIDSMMPMINDKIAQEKLVMESGLNWVIIRPTFLKDGVKTGRYQILEKAEFTAINGINRADVADFILKALESSDWNNKVVSVSS